MQLEQLHVESFRGIPKLDLDVGGSSVLIGENDSGKSSIVDALALCLGVDAEPGGFGFTEDDLPWQQGADPAPIRIVLTFGDESKKPRVSDALLPAVSRTSGGRSRILFEVLVRKAPPGVETTWRFLDAKERRPIEGVSTPEALRALRMTFPVVVLQAGVLRGSVEDPTSPGAGPDAAERAAVADLYRRIVARRGAVPPAEIAAGYERARALALERSRPGESAPAWLEAASGPRGTAARRLGLLIFVGAVLDALGPSRVDPDARPILAIENPEAHLHPMTLASVWDVIAGLDVQKLVTTQSGALLANVPLRDVRRLVRTEHEIRVHRLRSRTLDPEQTRKIRYHVRARRGAAFFARCWLLVEGETEFWMLPELARVCGHDFDVEGVCLVEFAQCGVVPLIKLAGDLGIAWHVLVDGDESGRIYGEAARRLLGGAKASERITVLPALDVERYLWKSGYADVYRRAATSRSGKALRQTLPGAVISRAIKRTSKPHLALTALHAIERAGVDGVPSCLRNAVEAVARMARRG